MSVTTPQGTSASSAATLHTYTLRAGGWVGREWSKITLVCTPIMQTEPQLQAADRSEATLPAAGLVAGGWAQADMQAGGVASKL